jgi:hypothetical protein
MQTSDLRSLTPRPAESAKRGGGIAGLALLFAFIGFCSSWLFFGGGNPLLNRFTPKTAGAAADYRIDKDDDLNANSHAVSQRYRILGALFGGASQEFTLHNDVAWARNILEAEDEPPGSIAQSCRMLLGIKDDDNGKQDNPALGSRMVSCYLTLNRPRLCSKEQGAELVILVKGFIAAKKLDTDLLGRIVRRNAPTQLQQQQWADHFYQTALGDLRDLGTKGYLSLQDFGWPVSPEIKELFDGAASNADPCRG